MTALLHWGLVVAVIVSLGSGLRIAGDAQGAHLPAPLAGVLMQGNVIAWHIWSSVGVTFVAVAYVVYVTHAGLTARIAVDAARLRALAAADGRIRWPAANVVGHWLAFPLVAGMAVSGTLLYLDRPLLPHAVVAGLHRMMAWGFVAYAAMHVGLQLAIGGPRHLLQMVAARPAHGRAARVAMLIGGATVALLYVLDDAAIRKLAIAKVEPADTPVVDGYFDDAAWARTRAVTIHTAHDGQPGGDLAVTVRALHDGQYAYFSFEWPDATRSQKHSPLLKTDDGWIVVGGDGDKENAYHEDKFAVMLARAARAGGGTSHLGPKPLAGAAGSPSGRGLHFTSDGSVVDLWQWQSVRTNPVGMVSDGYIGPPTLNTEAASDGGPAYVTGYALDPRTGGGATANYRRLDGDRVQPLYLPRTPFLTARLGRIDLAPDASDTGEWWLAKAETVPYSDTLDAQYPAGTVLPSVVIDGPLQGDRGDVRGVGRWHDGRWRLETVRRLHTGSEFDLPIVSGIYLWVAAFDHAQTRHSRHLHPLRLELAE